jgi:hypothetical protein
VAHGVYPLVQDADDFNDVFLDAIVDDMMFHRMRTETRSETVTPRPQLGEVPNGGNSSL